jgi:hypothetical protein
VTSQAATTKFRLSALPATSFYASTTRSAMLRKMSKNSIIYKSSKMALRSLKRKLTGI